MVEEAESAARPAATAFPGDSHSELRSGLERAVARVCPPWLADQREDLVQVALMRVMEIERKSEGERRFSSSYLWRVAYSALVDEIRRVRRRQEVPLEAEMGGSVMAAERPGPDDRAAASEIAQGLRECLVRMVRPRRLAVALHLQGHTVPEAARLLGWGAKRIENLVYRGLADLRRCLTEMGLTP